jgi:hypothetical protein
MEIDEESSCAENGVQPQDGQDLDHLARQLRNIQQTIPKITMTESIAFQTCYKLPSWLMPNTTSNGGLPCRILLYMAKDSLSNPAQTYKSSWPLFIYNQPGLGSWRPWVKKGRAEVKTA